MGMIVALVIILLILFFLGVLPVGNWQRNSVAQKPISQQPRQPRATTATRPHSVADMAKRRAGYVSEEDYVDVVDIGLLVYRHSDEPKLVRHQDVWLDTHFLRPFVELWLPYQARGVVRFELVDVKGRLWYADEVEYDLVHGKNTLLPNTWLPLQGKVVHPGQWYLRVLAGEVMLAQHAFGWQAVGDAELQRHIAPDGEISPELQRALREQPREAISLSELLADQDD